LNYYPFLSGNLPLCELRPHLRRDRCAEKFDRALVCAQRLGADRQRVGASLALSKCGFSRPTMREIAEAAEAEKQHDPSLRFWCWGLFDRGYCESAYEGEKASGISLEQLAIGGKREAVDRYPGDRNRT
jgi:hypothetical protein